MARKTPEGVKADGNKLRWDLLPLPELEDVVRVLTFGLVKYSAHNWMFVRPMRSRYYAAAMRHLEAWQKGEILDPETKLPHLAHAICCLLFLMWGDRNGVTTKELQAFKDMEADAIKTETGE